MKKYKFAFLAILPIFVLAGAGCSKSPKSFYKKICKEAVPFQEKLEDYYDSMGGSASNFEYYDDVDECVEESLEREEELYEECLYEECLDEEDEDECDDVQDDKGYKGLEKLVDEEDCQETIDEIREFAAEIYTQDGCEDMYGTSCSGYSKSSNQYDECMEEVEDLCEDLPEEF